MQKTLLMVCCFLCVTFSFIMVDAHSQSQPQPLPVKDEEKEKDYQDIINDFFTLAQDQQMTQAADGLFGDVLISTSPDISNKNYFDEVKAKLINLQNVYGNINSHSRMFERMVAKRLVFVDYIVLYDKQPIEFSFQFYKPKEKWMLYGFSLDTDIVSKLDSKIQDKMLISDTKIK